MTLEDIRAFNATRDTTYSVNKNDCRHYVNALCPAARASRTCAAVHPREVFGKNSLPVTPTAATTATRTDPRRPRAWNRKRRNGGERELAGLILAVTDLENMPVWIGSGVDGGVVFGVGVRAVPPA